jgi:hypothetical protein
MTATWRRSTWWCPATGDERLRQQQPGDRRRRSCSRPWGLLQTCAGALQALGCAAEACRCQRLGKDLEGDIAVACGGSATAVSCSARQVLCGLQCTHCMLGEARVPQVDPRGAVGGQSSLQQAGPATEGGAWLAGAAIYQRLQETYEQRSEV